MDGRKKADDNDDVDSIPVVHLNGMPSLAPGETYHGNHSSRFTDLHAEPKLLALASLRAPTSSYSSASFTIEKDGEMPEGAASVLRASATPPIIPTPSGASTPARVAAYEEYEVPEENPVEPIKVVRTKKKGTTKKKRTVEAS